MDAWQAEVRLICFVILLMSRATVPIVAGTTLPQFRLQVYGLTDAEHTGLDGRNYSGPRHWGTGFDALSADGRLVGDSVSGDGMESYLQSAWVSNGLQTQRIGLFDEIHTGPTGQRITVTYDINETGQAVGGSYRLLDNTNSAWSYSGISGWIYDGNEARRIGLFDSPLAAGDPAFSDHAAMINDQGHVLGLSYPGHRRGRQAWSYDGSITRPIGLSEVEHLNIVGYPSHEILGQNNGGQAIGTAVRYHDANGNLLVARGLSLQSTSAWYFDGQDTIRLGYTDGAHTTRTGIQSSAPVAITDSGLVAGHSLQFSGTEGCDDCYQFPTGKTAWVYHNGVTRKVGFPELRDWYGTGNAEIQQVSANGLVAGITRYQPTPDWDHPLAWVDDGTETVAIEIPAPEFPDGLLVQSEKRIEGFTDQNGVVINSNFFSFPSGPAPIGSAWEFREGSLRELGFFDPAHSRPDGRRRSQVTQILNGRVIVGVSERYSDGDKVSDTLWADYGTGAIPLEVVEDEDEYGRLLYSDLVGSNLAGQLAGNTVYLTEGGEYVARPWYYDPTTGLMPIGVLESTRMRMLGLTEAGWLYGSLTPLGEEPYGLGIAFLWHPTTGLLRLSDLIKNEFPADFHLDQVVQGIGSSFFAGQGTRANGSFAFLAVAVPEPSTGVFILLAIMQLSRSPRRPA